MKRSILAVMSLYIMLSAATSASALTYGSIEVGERDILLGSTALSSSGDSTELAWVQSFFNYTITLDTKYDTSDSNWHLTNESGTYAMALDTNPEFFMIKTGNLGKQKGLTNTHFLFDNRASIEWAVLNLSESFGTGYTINNVGKFSHVNEFGSGGTPPPVPEPGTVMLLGFGMLGLVVYGKRRMNK
jgi:hypothetical protein